MALQVSQIFIVDIIYVLLYKDWTKTREDSPQYNINPENVNHVIFLSFFSSFLILIRIMPLDLIISIEIAKMFTCKYINWDVHLIKPDY